MQSSIGCQHTDRPLQSCELLQHHSKSSHCVWMHSESIDQARQGAALSAELPNRQQFSKGTHPCRTPQIHLFRITCQQLCQAIGWGHCSQLAPQPAMRVRQQGDACATKVSSLKKVGQLQLAHLALWEIIAKICREHQLYHAPWVGLCLHTPPQ